MPRNTVAERTPSASASYDAAFLHGLEQRALDLGCGAVDFIREEKVGENAALVRAELALGLVENFRADDVRRKKIDGELHAAELQIDGARQTVDK